MKWSLAVALGMAMVGAACAARPVAQRQAAPPARAQVAAGLVYVNGADQALWVVDSATGQVTRTLPAGTPSPDWSRLYHLGSGVLDALDTLDGRVLASHPAPAWAEAVGTSADGRWLVFSRAGPDGRFQVQDTAWAAGPVSVALRGSFTFDAISGDGQRLYLLEWLGTARYQVRMYDVGKGQLAPYVIVDKSEIDQPMSGQALAGYTTRDGSMRLTLYQRSAKGQAFVHALPLGSGLPFAFCVDLPGPADGWGFVAAPDGGRFYAVNPSDRRVVELWAESNGQPTLRAGRLDGQPPTRGSEPATAISPDGATLYIGTGSRVVAMDANTLQVRTHGLDGQQITSLAVARDGGALYAVVGATRLLRLDPNTLTVAGEVTVGGPLGAIVHTS